MAEAATLSKQLDLYRLINNALENLKKLGKAKMTKGAVQVRITQLDRNWDKFEENHDAVSGLQNDDKFKNDAYFTQNTYSLCEEAFYSNKAELVDLLESMSAQPSNIGNDSVSNQGGGALPSSNNQRSLPKINLPKFSGRYQEWTPFRDIFLSLVGNNESVPPVEKLHHLKMSLSEKAARLIAAIPVNDDKYARVWEELELRFENKRALINAQLDTLFSLKPVTRKCARDLEHLRSTVSAVLEALQALGGPIDQWDFLLVYMVSHRLDAETHEAWELKLGNSTEPPTYEELNVFLESRVRALENVDARTPPPRSPQSVARTPQRSSSSQVHTASPVSPARRYANNACACCAGPHFIALCPQYRAKSPEQRRDIVRIKKMCFNCLGNHQLSNCRSTKLCLSCGLQHHTTLHLSTSPAATPTPGGQSTEAAGTSAVQLHHQGQQPTNTGTAQSCHVNPAASPAGYRQPALLATAVVNAISPLGRQVNARVLLDQGSELTFVCESLVQALKLARSSGNIPLCGVGAQACATTRGVVTLRLQHRLDPSIEVNVEAHILSRLTGKIPAEPVFPVVGFQFTDMELADPTYAVPGPIDILLGANIYAHLLHEEIRKTDVSSPVAQSTVFGWVLSGPMSVPASATSELVPARSYTSVLDQDLNEMVQRFWSQEEVPKSAQLSSEDKFCEEHFQSTHSRQLDGHYVVRLPFKSLLSGQEESRTIANRMLQRMHKRFQQDASLKARYSEFMRDYFELHHMKTLDPDQVKDAYFLPHHGVVRETSISTKLRVVFNASQKVSDGSTLNDFLYAGPKLQIDLMDVLLRWRRYLYVFSADVEKMYRQILIHPDDQKHQCVLWSTGPSDSPTAYRLCTVTYGMNCAPYLALRVLQQLAFDEGNRFPMAATVLRENIYVDDVLAGGNTIETAKEKVQQIDNLLKAGGFTLKKWVANEEVLDSIEEDRRLPRDKRVGDQDTLRALGLKWNPATDTFMFSFEEEAMSTTTLTKRVVLSDVAKLYDPLGWLAPVIVSAKIFLQSLWKISLGWDDPLPENIATRWRTYRSELQTSPMFSIPRWLGTLEDSSVELHGFCDASKSAMAAVLYVRVVEDYFKARAILLVAKTKVAPAKPVTIARLELSAAVLLSELMTHTQQSLGLSSVPTYMWTDSSVALTWISGSPSRWKEYVGNRVAHIRELQPNARWNHVAGANNPADAACRGMTPEQLQKHSCWWSGPEWLKLPSTSWPNTFPRVMDGTNLEERPAVVLIAAPAPESIDLIYRHSSIVKVLRITARAIDVALRRFRRQNAASEGSPVVSQEMLAKACTFWVRITQEAYFSTEIVALKRAAEKTALESGSDLNSTSRKGEKRPEVPRSSPLVRLSPFLDSEGLIRVGGRLDQSSFSEDVKHSYVLPRNARLSELLIQQAHLKTLHGGTQLTMSLLRQRVWIIGGRAPVKTVIQKCLPCVRQRGVTLQQKMGQLPPSRVTPARPFLNAGVDYAGPFVVKAWSGRKAKTYKSYLVLFVCFATSPVHLELAPDASTNGFLSAFRKFTGRRGRCAHLCSDCGTNFIGADAELKKLFNEASEDFVKIREALAQDGTEWTFNPPSAPHFGGKWVAAVKSVKFHIKRVVGDSLLTSEELTPS